MTTLHNVCPECGLPIKPGLSNCPYCQTQVGTIFSESAPMVQPARSRNRQAASYKSYDERIEKARERGNNALILALVSFFCPGVGLILGITAIVFGSLALMTFKEFNIEDGRGAALASLIIGMIGLIAQASYVLYFLRAGGPY